jgi:DNA-binding MarR family transcriptional regulator
MIPAHRRDRQLGPVLEFLRLLWEIEHLLRSRSKQMHRRIGITGPQRLVLRICERFPGISPGELARLVHLHPSTLTGILARLERRALIVRRPDPADRRRATLRARPRRASSRLPPNLTVEVAVQRALRAATPRETRHARMLLERLAAALGSGFRSQTG